MPGPGRIQVDGQTVLLATYSSQFHVGAELSISTSPTEQNPSPAGVAVWAEPGDQSTPSNVVRYETVPTTRTVAVGAKGTYTYYLVGKGGVGIVDGGALYHHTSQLRATWFSAP